MKPYYDRFLKELPTITDLANAKEDRLMKLWEGLGYYNRVRNMQKAAIQMVEQYGGQFPESYEEIHALTGIGNYTAGAIGSFAFGIPKPAVDGNVLRVVSRILASREDIMKAKVRTAIETALEEVIPKDCPGDFNQGLIELGAIVCVPNGEPKCEICPAAEICRARKEGIAMELPVKTKAKGRKSKRGRYLYFMTVILWQFRNVRTKDFSRIIRTAESGRLAESTRSDRVQQVHRAFSDPYQKLPAAKHIFSHVEWQMKGYEIQVDELEKNCSKE